ncbi:hypothetical protein BSQ98_16010 [Serratia liquefaciens]|nr:hypothetical protein BSQ98_16010 [Serratia liquefaciens]
MGGKRGENHHRGQEAAQETRGRIIPSYLKPHLCWLHPLTRITYLSKLVGMSVLAALMPLQLFRV